MSESAERRTYTLNLGNGDVAKISKETFEKFQEAVSAMVNESGASSIDVSTAKTGHGFTEHTKERRTLFLGEVVGP